MSYTKKFPKGTNVVVTAQKEFYVDGSKTITVHQLNQTETIRLVPYIPVKYNIHDFDVVLGGVTIDPNNLSFKTYINGVEKDLVTKTSYAVHRNGSLVDVDILNPGEKATFVYKTVLFPPNTNVNIVCKILNSPYNYEEKNFTDYYTGGGSGVTQFIVFDGYARFTLNNVRLETVVVGNGTTSIGYTNSTNATAYLKDRLYEGSDGNNTRTLTIPFSDSIKRSNYDLRVVPNSSLKGYNEYNSDNYIHFVNDESFSPILTLKKVNAKVKVNFSDTYDTLDLVYTNPQGNQCIINSYNVSGLSNYIIQESDIYAVCMLKVTARKRGVVVASSNIISLNGENLDTEISL